MIAIYIRVSTIGQNVAGQKREINRWLNGNGIADDQVRWYVDKSTGNNLDRPAFEQLQAAVFAGDIKTVVVWKLDRLSRSLRDGINVLADWCDKGLRVVSVTQQIDFNGAVGKMLAAVLLGVAEMETEMRRERQAVGIAVAKENGIYKGRMPGATKKGVNPERAGKLRQKGLTYGEISQAMGVSQSSVRRYLGAI
ncbi:MAG: recombinase family protein [Planctomycetota bacterium]|nr:recombinase family protein [Planctomycetota bacterium]